MRPKSALLLATLTAATAATAWAGSLGNGAAQRNAAYGNKPAMQQKQTSYSYCYGGNNHVEYFSRVFPIVRATSGGGGGPETEFGHYLTGMGYNNDAGHCRGAPTMNSAVADKQTSESTFQSEEYHHRNIVETDWAGH